MERNSSVDYMRLVASILVVVIHTAPFTDIHPFLTYSIVDVLPRIAVPFFFAISGFYFITGSADKQLKQILNITKTYIFVTIVYLIYSILYSVVFKTEFTFSVTTFIFNFFITGIEYHLWFFPALIYSMLFFYILNRVFKSNKVYWCAFAVSLGLYLIGVLGCSYYKIGVKIPGTSVLFDNPYFEIIRRMIMMGFVFFTSGYLARFLNERLSAKASAKASAKSLIVSGVLFVVEIYALYFFKLYNTVVITLFLYPLTVSLIWYLVSHPKYQNISYARYCKRTSAIMYYYHPILLSLLYTFNDNKVFNFLIVVAVFAVLGLIKNIFANKSMKVRSKNAGV